MDSRSLDYSSQGLGFGMEVSYLFFGMYMAWISQVRAHGGFAMNLFSMTTM